MCGLAGHVHLRPDLSAEVLAERANAMAGPLAHRGPDASGTWSDPAAGVGLGHTRLAIIDVGDDGAQPMVSADGRWVLVYNGEIYNFRDLRRRLEGLGVRFRGHSDTEVLIEAIAAWGVSSTLKSLNGMFAFGVWDRERGELHLARDRIGEKPLYHAWAQDAFLFGSELRAIREHPSFEARIDQDAVASLLKWKAIPAPQTIYQGVRKLPPATHLIVEPRSRNERLCTYWSALNVPVNGLSNPLTVSAEETVDLVDDLLRDAVERRMIADVPLGAFLSGGIDSSTVVAVMQVVGERPVRTFTIGVHDPRFDEAEHAKRIAGHLGTDHTELYVTEREIRNVVPQLPAMYDEPFADSSQVPTFLVSQMAREHVTVALSGDGGDELFGGYNRHVWGPTVHRTIELVPHWLRSVGSRALRSASPSSWDRLATTVGAAVPQARQRLAGDKLYKLARALPANGAADLYDRLVSHWLNPAAVVKAGHAKSVSVPDELQDAPFAATAMYLDMVHYLPTDILTKVDRASMAVSLEVRVPFLDHRLIELAWRIPVDRKVDRARGKLPLRRLLSRYVPTELFERPKSGFGVPIGEWLRGPLKSWGEDLLSPERLRRQGIIRPEPVRQAWDAHQSGRMDLQYQLWDVLMFEAWLEEHHGD